MPFVPESARCSSALCLFYLLIICMKFSAFIWFDHVLCIEKNNYRNGSWIFVHLYFSKFVLKKWHFLYVLNSPWKSQGGLDLLHFLVKFRKNPEGLAPPLVSFASLRSACKFAYAVNLLFLKKNLLFFWKKSTVTKISGWQVCFDLFSWHYLICQLFR